MSYSIMYRIDYIIARKVIFLTNDKKAFERAFVLEFNISQGCYNFDLRYEDWQLDSEFLFLFP